MSQQSQTTPVVTTNIAGNRQQANLRDYLNQRVAPFLKKAIHESLETEAEYPLQWLGEHLIQQSILYEGNPDTTNIRERFAYKHDMTTTTTRTASNDAVEAMPTSTPTPPSEQRVEALPATNGTLHEPEASTLSSDPQTLVDGVSGEAPQVDTTTKDTEMGGTT